MADLVLAPRSGFAGLLHDHGIQPAGLRVADRDGMGIASVVATGDDSAGLAERIGDLFGVNLPSGPQRTLGREIAFIGTGPGRWLAIAENGHDGFSAALDAQLQGVAAVSDQSDGYAVLRLTGPALRDILAKGVNIDLHPAVFGVNDTAATAIAHIGVILWRLPDAPDGAPAFEIALFRSMAGSFWHWLSTSAGAYGLAVDTADPG